MKMLRDVADGRWEASVPLELANELQNFLLALRESSHGFLNCWMAKA
jgi:hypothetical protein